MNNQALRNRFAHDVDTGKRAGLFVDLIFDLSDVFRCEVDRNEDNLRVDSVFRLRKEIGSDEVEGLSKIDEDDGGEGFVGAVQEEDGVEEKGWLGGVGFGGGVRGFGVEEVR